MDERGFSDGRISRVDIWTIFGAFAADSVQISTLVWRVSNYPCSCSGHAGPLPNPPASSPVRCRAAAPYGYTLGDSTRFAPAGASKETAYAHHLNRPSHRCRRAAGARHHPPRLPSSAARPCPSSTRTPTCCATPHRAARLLYLACDDENKAFAIGFKTPPADSTGVFHILEHSVLCGSAKFPVKEPFVDLIKSSMQTFLNAMTYPDKTIYPVATTNEQDLYNLMDVYLDAVFNPAIYTKPTILSRRLALRAGPAGERRDRGQRQLREPARGHAAL